MCSATEAARILHVHPATVLRWVRAGKLLVAGKLGGTTGSYVLYRADVERLRDARDQRKSA